MRDLVLVDSQPARVRLFREAIAVYRERLEHLQTRSEVVTESARTQMDRARKASRALQSATLRRRVFASRRQAPDEVRLHVFPCTEEALKFLRQKPPYEWAPRPTMVFTDLYLEENARTSVIEELKADAGLRSIPAVTLCSEASEAQIREAWAAGSNAVVRLSGEAPAMLSQVADTLEFWLQEAVL